MPRISGTYMLLPVSTCTSFATAASFLRLTAHAADEVGEFEVERYEEVLARKGQVTGREELPPVAGISRRATPPVLRDDTVKVRS